MPGREREEDGVFGGDGGEIKNSPIFSTAL